MDAPRLLVLIFLLLILFASPETQTVSPSQQRQLDHLILQERYALSLLNTSQYGDLDSARNRWVNVTGLRKDDGYAWDLLPKIQERVRQQTSTVITAWHKSTEDGKDFTSDGSVDSSNGTVVRAHVDRTPPLYQNITGVVNGQWVRSKVAGTVVAPVLNLTAMVPGVNYVTDHYSRNITGTEGRMRIKLDEKKSKILEVQNITMREITAELTLRDQSSSGDGWEMTLHGIHFPREGSVVLTTTSQRFAGIFAVPYFTLSPTSFASSRQYLDITLSEAIKLQESASETNTFSPWSSSPYSSSDLLFPTPHCEYIVYLQQHPIDTHSSDVESIETELRYPTGRSNLPSPPLQLSALIFSPDCGFILESKGPPDYAPRHGSHLRGPKLEIYVRSGRRAILAFAVVVCAELSLLLHQIREASTPSTRSRISFYTIGMMAMGDGFVCMSFLVISILLDAAFLPLVGTAFLAFLCVSFFGMKFLLDIWTVQAPEREERRREVEQRNAIANPAPPPSTSANNSMNTAGNADTLPLPVTAPRPQGVQASEGRNQAATNPAPGQPTVTPDPTITERRQLSALYTKFYLLLVVLLFLTAYSTTWPPILRTVYIRALSVSYLSFFLPQMYRNIIRNCRKALQWRFVVGQSVLRTCPFFYFYVYTDNVLFVENDSNWTIALVGWMWFQVWILASQELFGPRFFVPKACDKWLPIAYDYHPVLREEDLENGLSMPVGFTQATAAFPDGPADVSSSDNERSREKGVDPQRGKMTLDCAICMQSFDVPVVPRRTEGGGIAATTAAQAGTQSALTQTRQTQQGSVMYLHLMQCLDLPLANQSSSAADSVSLRLNGLPNPYRIPNSDLILDFFDHNTGPVFSRTVILGVIDRARKDVLARMADKGDVEIPPGTHQSKYGGLAFVYESMPPHRIMKYTEVLAVIRGLSAKERHDGNKYRLATVYYEDVIGYHIETGDVALVAV
ncbi:MAG: hypothetical protein Q9218_007324, partial [Villophora microphyllina]